MQKGIYIVTGQLTVNEFIEALFEAQREPPAFAMPAWAEAVISLETLNKRHTNLDEGGFANGYEAFGISLLKRPWFRQQKPCMSYRFASNGLS